MLVIVRHFSPHILIMSTFCIPLRVTVINNFCSSVIWFQVKILGCIFQQVVNTNLLSFYHYLLMLHCIIDIDECHSSHCQYGTCEDLPNGYKCNCNHGYTGTNCETGNMMQPISQILTKVNSKNTKSYFMTGFI